ncbi:MAG TPA: type II secretion system protein [Candidatus Saccharimonadia bacterium]|nr:type II secretion system protein [Candidatus Saccharimonadia bacterium]
MRKLNLNQRGDTIVEVLIAMVILAFVLTGAYISAQYSLNTIENARNRIGAIGEAQNQLEELKAWVASRPAISSIPTSNNFYMNLSGSSYVPVATVGNSFSVPGTIYSIFIKHPGIDSDNGNYYFTIFVTWNDLHFSSTQDSVDISYRTAVL